ncbi:MAG: hypothetical protein V1811_00040 [Candidatus Micrarchaeota archaeon]
MRSMLFALLAFSVLALAISSDEATVKATPYVGEDSSDILQLNKPMQAGADSYWAFFHSILSTKKILIAVSDYSGAVVTDRQKLSQVGLGVYQYGVIEEVLKKNNWGFDAFDASLSGASSAVSENSRKLSDLRSGTEVKYSISYNKLDGAMQRLSDKIFEAQDTISNGKSLQQSFELDYSTSAVASLLRHYNTTYNKLFDVLSAYDNYTNAISELKSQVYRSSIPDPDNKNIYSNLEALEDVGLSSLYSLKANDPRVALNRKNADAGKWVNDSIESFFYRKMRFEALDAYENLRPNAQALLASEANVKSCGYASDFDRFKTSWAEVEYLKSKANAAAYVQMVNKTTAAQALYSTLLQKYQACVNPSIPTTSPYIEPKQDYSWLLVLVVIGAGFIIYNEWKKRQQEETY